MKEKGRKQQRKRQRAWRKESRTFCQRNGVRGQGLMTHFVGVEACWHEVQSGTGTARERGEEWVQPATHRKTVTYTHDTRTAAERDKPQ